MDQTAMGYLQQILQAQQQAAMQNQQDILDGFRQAIQMQQYAKQTEALNAQAQAAEEANRQAQENLRLQTNRANAVVPQPEQSAGGYQYQKSTARKKTGPFALRTSNPALASALPAGVGLSIPV